MEAVDQPVLPARPYAGSLGISRTRRADLARVDRRDARQASHRRERARDPQLDLALETIARNDTSSAIAFFEQERDYVSCDIAAKIVIDSEQHIDYPEKQRELYRALGKPNCVWPAAGGLTDPI
jgi:hypothetical protein